MPFNKYLFIIFLHIYVVAYANAQYYDFPFKGWKQTYTGYTWSGIQTEIDIATLIFDRDTVIEGKKYISSGYTFYRSENGKVIQNIYNWQNLSFHENVEYDFSLLVGDRFVNETYTEEDSVRVIKKEKIVNLLGDSIWRMDLQVHLSWLVKDTIAWIEGVGDLHKGLIKTNFPDGGFIHACTLLSDNRKIMTNPKNTDYCNCRYVYGVDNDNDGYGNYTPRTVEIKLGHQPSGPFFIYYYKARACDTLKIINPDNRQIVLSESSPENGYCEIINPDIFYFLDIDGNLGQTYIYYDVQKYKKLYVSHQCSFDYAQITLSSCFENDCEDNNPQIHPGHPEIPYNNIDDDCNPSTPDDDIDQDGFIMSDDCNDNNPNVNPDKLEIIYNGLDDDCNELTLDDDLDKDGFMLSVDCNDNNPNINPAQPEMPYNGADDDCSVLTPDDDLDQDGFILSDDCNDNNPNINPAQTEMPYNGADDDCSVLTPDDDLDQDGFMLSDDCNDNNPNINPAQTEMPYNGADDDCSILTPDDDLDQDGFMLSNDCNDNSAEIYPGATEIPNNGIDENCDGEDLVNSTIEPNNLKIKIYPNPANEVIKIGTDGLMEYTYYLYDLSGRIISSGINQKVIMISSLNAGIYVLNIKDLNTGKEIFAKIVVNQ